MCAVEIYICASDAFKCFVFTVYDHCEEKRSHTNRFKHSSQHQFYTVIMHNILKLYPMLREIQLHVMLFFSVQHNVSHTTLTFRFWMSCGLIVELLNETPHDLQCLLLLFV